MRVRMCEAGDDAVGEQADFILTEVRGLDHLIELVRTVLHEQGPLAMERDRALELHDEVVLRVLVLVQRLEVLLFPD